ncbi:hypothetical protein [uncultured Hymenobacter sp.]|uniref:hypothetical protein n=1 Tax=uncultured Hymenobacter sp. TaxID=170016 RepID=UPI0035CA651D
MDNSDLPLIVAEMLIEIQHLKERVALLEGAFPEVRDDLRAIHSSVQDMHTGYEEQSDKLSQVLEKITAIIRERNAAPDSPPPAPPEPRAGSENPLS